MRFLTNTDNNTTISDVDMYNYVNVIQNRQVYVDVYPKSFRKAINPRV